MTEESSAKAHSSGPSIRHSPWKCVGTAAWVILLILVGFRLAAYYYIPKDLREQVALAERTIVSLPRDWHKPADLPPTEIINFHTHFAKEMEALRNKHERLLFGSGTAGFGLFEKQAIDRTFTADELTSLPQLIEDLKPLIDLTSSTFSQPGYSFETDGIGRLSFLENHTFTKLMYIVAAKQAQDGDCRAAMETLLLPLQMVSRPEQSHVMSHLIAVALANVSVIAVGDLADNCSDTLVLKYGIESLNNHRPSVYPGEIEHWLQSELVSLRFAAAYGYPVDLSPKSKARYIREFSRVMYSKDYYRWLISHSPPSDPKVSYAEKHLAMLSSRDEAKFGTADYFTDPYAPAIRKSAVRVLTGLDPDVMYVASMSIGAEDLIIRASHSLARYDLVRVKLAKRLAVLEGKKSNITDYLSPLPQDPFSSTPFLYDLDADHHYSVGPDKDDDGAATIYDSTNGSITNGDIWIER